MLAVLVLKNEAATARTLALHEPVDKPNSASGMCAEIQRSSSQNLRSLCSRSLTVIFSAANSDRLNNTSVAFRSTTAVSLFMLGSFSANSVDGGGVGLHDSGGTKIGFSAKGTAKPVSMRSLASARCRAGGGHQYRVADGVVFEAQPLRPTSTMLRMERPSPQ